jgi:hypothetical protein
LIPSPTFNNTNAPANASSISGLTSQPGIDRLRQYVIFELVNIKDSGSNTPQSQPVFPYMILHMNPDSFEVSYSKLINRQATRGGFVEQHWGEELDSISCSGSTGLFITLDAGLSALNRKASIAYRKYLELVALYRNNGLVYDQRGEVIFEGGIKMYFDGDIYTGYFENMTITESADKPFTFDVSFNFKVKTTLKSVGP